MGFLAKQCFEGFAESHPGAAAAVFFSWKLKPTQQKTVGLRDQGRLFGDPIEEARRAKKLRVDYSIPSAEFAAVGYYIPSDKVRTASRPSLNPGSQDQPSIGRSPFRIIRLILEFLRLCG